jgi:aspartate beta-hydroxylase
MSPVSDARELLRSGRIAEAERVYEQVLDQSPDDIEALNVVAMAALRGGQAARALQLLEHAAQVDPAHAVTRNHLGSAREAVGDLPGARAAYQEAVRLRPQLHIARLHLAFALEQLGEPQRAAWQYARAIKDAQQEGRWLNAASTPPGLRFLVERAVHNVRAERRNLLSNLIEPLAQRFGSDSLGRVERCLRVYLKEELPIYPDPRQQPTFLYFPDLPPAAYLDLSLFPWIEDLESRTPEILRELHSLLPSAQGRERVFTTEELERQNLRGLDVAPSWNGYYFYRHGERRDENATRCPQTSAALEALPLARVRGHAPEVLFSVFTPGTHLTAHRGVTNTRLVAHLPLLVPEDCALRVGGEIHHWQEGRVVVFDDTYEHEAWNRSSRTRVVLIFDLWHPLLSEVERVAVAALVEGIGDYDKAIQDA